MLVALKPKRGQSARQVFLVAKKHLAFHPLDIELD